MGHGGLPRRPLLQILVCFGAQFGTPKLNKFDTFSDVIWRTLRSCFFRGSGINFERYWVTVLILFEPGRKSGNGAIVTATAHLRGFQGIGFAAFLHTCSQTSPQTRSGQCFPGFEAGFGSLSEPAALLFRHPFSDPPQGPPRPSSGESTFTNAPARALTSSKQRGLAIIAVEVFESPQRRVEFCCTHKKVRKTKYSS